jgi:hypothetical protein
MTINLYVYNTKMVLGTGFMNIGMKKFNKKIILFKKARIN